MEWFYAVDGEQQGPIDDAELQQLVEVGTITPQTLVWNETLDGWKRYSELSRPVGQGVAGQGEAGQVQCGHCQQFFPSDDLIAIGGVPTCASCKPLAVQQLQEGVSMPGDLVVAGFWWRVLAQIIDWVIVGGVEMIIQKVSVLIGGMIFPDTPAEQLELITALVLWPITFGARIAYDTWFIGKYAATPGKMVCKLKVVMPDGGRVSYLRAFARFWAEILSSCFTLGIGYLIAAFDDERRTLHDHICSTRVVMK